MENGLLYILAFSAMAVALFACVLPQVPIEIVPGAPSFTVYQVGLTYYAKDQNGHIEYSSTNASDVVVHAQNALPISASIKTIMFSTGIYFLSGIPIMNATRYLGDGATLMLPNGVNTAIFNQSDADLSNVVFEKLFFASETYGNIGIYAKYFNGSVWRNADGVKVLNCNFTNFYYGYYTISTNSLYQGNTFMNNTIGLLFDGGSKNTVCYNNFQIPTLTDGDGVGVWITDSGFNNFNNNKYSAYYTQANKIVAGVRFGQGGAENSFVNELFCDWGTLGYGIWLGTSAVSLREWVIGCKFINIPQCVRMGVNYADVAWIQNNLASNCGIFVRIGSGSVASSVYLSNNVVNLGSVFYGVGTGYSIIARNNYFGNDSANYFEGEATVLFKDNEGWIDEL